MSPEVSVVIPAFDREATISRAITSVLAQTWDDFEIIVTDDGSLDKTVAVVEGFRDPRIRMVRHERNRGAAAARNSAIQTAKGKFIAFLDSDDEWFPEKLTVQLGQLRVQPADTCVSCTGVILHLLDRGIRREHRLEDSVDWCRRLTLGCDERPGSTLMARRDVFARVGLLDESLRRYEDWDWLLRYTSDGSRVLAISTPLAHIYNTRGRLARQSEQSAVQLLAKHNTLFSALDPTDRRRSLCDLWLQIATSYALEGQLGNAGRLALRALRRRPIYAVKRLVGNGIEFISLRCGFQRARLVGNPNGDGLIFGSNEKRGSQMSEPAHGGRSNLEYWKRLQDKDYFENHPCYNGLRDLGDEVTSNIEQFLKLEPTMRVVVIGCGYGRESAYIAPRVRHVYGIDVSDTILRKAEAYLAGRSITNFTGVLADHYENLVPDGIDLVFSIVVMQHLTRDLVRAYFRTLGRKLAPNGGFVVQFLEELFDGVEHADAELRAYEPSISWNARQITQLQSADLRLVAIHTSLVTPTALWHWAHFRRNY